MNFWNYITDGLLFTNKGTQEALTNASNKYSEDMDKINKDMKTTEQLYNEGASVAGQQANNKAGIAKKQSKAAAAMANAPKAQQALISSQMANDAATTGFDEAAQNATNLASSIESDKIANKRNAAQNAYDTEIARINAKENQKNSVMDRALKTGQMLTNFAKK